MAKRAARNNDTAASLGFEAKLWAAADALRNNMDAAEYKHVVLGLIFLKYISDAFEAKHSELEAQKAQGADPEDPDEYRAASIFWVPKEARWQHLKASAPQPTIGTLVDDAMTAIERDNPSLKGVLPKDYARPGLDKQRLGQLINLVSDIAFNSPLPRGEGQGDGGKHSPLPRGEGQGERVDRAKDTLGRVYEYFLSQFASAEGKKGGQFYTPSRVVRVLVEMLAPYKGRVYDPCCGSGGMFVSSEKFIEAHAGKLGDISIYGQESNYTTWRLAKMNLAIRGIDAQIAHGDTFHNDKHPDLKADYVLSNPPFNDSDWRGELLKDDKRWVYGVPPAGNANFAWVQHFIHHLAPTGLAGFVLANGSMSSNQSGEGEIRKAIIEADLVDCMVALPGQLFYSTQIPVCLWFLRRDKRRLLSPSGRGATSSLPLPGGEGEKQYRGGFDFSGLAQTARELRKKQTPTEAVMWELLRDRRFMNLKFRRQHQVGEYVVDFYCDEHKLAVELDGPVHDEVKQAKKDKTRDAYLQSLGLTVLRLHNKDFLADPEAALTKIAQAYPSPTGRGAGGEGVAVYRDIPGFCKSATLDDIRKHGHVLTPGRYVGAEAAEDDGEPFEDKMKRLTATLREQQKEAAKLDAAIAANLKELGYGG
ncbi:MAG: N-6 DNA methylase [Pseudomonadota bacterium]